MKTVLETRHKKMHSNALQYSIIVLNFHKSQKKESKSALHIKLKSNIL